LKKSRFNDFCCWTLKNKEFLIHDKLYLVLVAFLLFTLVIFFGCSSQSPKCIDVTSYDYNWENDMRCTRSDGSTFYTDYAGAREFEKNNR